MRGSFTSSSKRLPTEEFDLTFFFFCIVYLIFSFEGGRTYFSYRLGSMGAKWQYNVSSFFSLSLFLWAQVKIYSISPSERK